MKGLVLIIILIAVLQVSAQETTTQKQTPPPRKTIKLPNDRAAEIPNGPFKPTWESIKENYKTPQWFIDGKFGIFMHWGVYSVPAHFSEWYPRHMYNNPDVVKYHAEKYGAQDKFGYKDFIPMFTCEKYNPDDWAALFKESGARYVIPTAEHHDGFALYDSDLTKWDAKDMGPKRDLIGDLAKAVRKKGLKFGVSNHRLEHWDFMYPGATDQHDLYDPQYADFYGPPQKPDPKNSAMGPGKEEVMEGRVHQAPQSNAFLEEWLARCQEMVDKYQPDMVWFDNGINSRSLDSIKLRFAAYYYNRAAKWGKEVSVSSKSDAYLYGTIEDYERQGRAPKILTDYHWHVDEPIGHKFGYVEELRLQSGSSVIRKLVENISRNGNLTLNISPKSDGTIPDDQQAVLKEVGRWLKTNGEAVYDSKAWKVYGEGPSVEGSEASEEYRFTANGNTIYAFALKLNDDKTIIQSVVNENSGKIKKVTLLGSDKKLNYETSDKGLEIELPNEKPLQPISVFKIEF